MDNERIYTQSEKIRIAKSGNLRLLVEERCKFLGRDDVEECINDQSKRAVMYQSYSFKKNKERKISESNEAVNESASGLPVAKLRFHKNQFVVEGHENITVFATMTEGLTFDDGKRQIPEIKLSFKRGSTDGRGSATLTVREMNNSMSRSIKKSVNSLKTDLINRKTEYPDSLEKAIEYLEFNFNSRVSSNFGFEIDAGVMLKTRFAELFTRAYSGTRLLTTEAFI